MKAVCITVLLALLTSLAPAEISPFVVDKPITKREWKKIREKEKLLHEVLDFEALRLFLINESKERIKVVFGDDSDPASLNLEEDMPEDKWKLSSPRRLIYTSGSWSWNFDEVIRASFFQDEVFLFWDISVTDRDEFTIKAERYEDDRYTLY